MAPIPHDFADAGLLELALTHASTGLEKDNERLEFLGDAVLDLIIAEELYEHEAELAEGQLTELKAYVVSRKVLAVGARKLGLQNHARVGAGMRNRTLTRSVLANLYEAVLGAVYLDAGLAAARTFALQTLSEPVESVSSTQVAPNPKQELQRHGQLQTGDPPEYVLLDERGHAHARAFLVAARIGEQLFPSAWGRTLKEAERWAAHEALLVLHEDADS